jgi:hypothetical protein
MDKEGSAVDTVLKYSAELNSIAEYNYIVFVRAHEKAINYMYRMMQKNKLLLTI